MRRGERQPRRGCLSPSRRGSSPLRVCQKNTRAFSKNYLTDLLGAQITGEIRANVSHFV